MGQLEQLLDVVRHESSRERQFLVEQQDLFLVEIMSDHDRQVAELQRSLVEATTRRADPRQIAELVAQRNQAREYSLRCERERDLAWQELAAGHASAPTPSSSPAPSSSAMSSSAMSASSPSSSRKSGATAIGSIALKAVQVASQLPESERQPTGYSLSGDEVSK